MHYTSPAFQSDNPRIATLHQPTAMHHSIDIPTSCCLGWRLLGWSGECGELRRLKLNQLQQGTLKQHEKGQDVSSGLKRGRERHRASIESG
jgi:hypothetical protein